MNRRRNRRRGATIVEMSIVLSVFLMLTLGMIDLGTCVFRYHVLSNAARQGARRAIVHGALANSALDGGPWGPTTIDVAATSTSTPIVGGAHDGIAGLLVGCNPAQTTIEVQWTKNSNAVGQPVQVTLSTPYTPVMWFLTGGTLTAASTMQIVH